MRILSVDPIAVYNNSFDDTNENSILVGKCYGELYVESNLVFRKISKSKKEELIKATLKMYCDNTCGSSAPFQVCINTEEVSTVVSGIGNYEWNVTSFIEFNDNFELCVFTKDQINGCGMKKFEVFGCSSTPVLELIIDEVDQNPERKIIDLVEECISATLPQHTDWIDCSNFDEYYYFIQNLGKSDIEIYLEISPDKNMKYTDSGPYMIRSKEVSYHMPYRFSKYIRIKYKNISSTSNKVKIWFQAKK